MQARCQRPTDLARQYLPSSSVPVASRQTQLMHLRHSTTFDCHSACPPAAPPYLEVSPRFTLFQRSPQRLVTPPTAGVQATRPPVAVLPQQGQQRETHGPSQLFQSRASQRDSPAQRTPQTLCWKGALALDATSDLVLELAAYAKAWLSARDEKARLLLAHRGGTGLSR